jgi:protein O-mannosyl-transferase
MFERLKSGMKLASLPPWIKMTARNKNQIKTLIICLFLIIAVLLVFGQVGSFDFSNYDDQEYVTKNPRVQSGLTVGSIVWALGATHFANWHPFTWLSYMADYELYGLKAGGYHFTNILFHLINTLLLFFLLKRMTKATGKSAFVAALFALHPLHVESVAWISERKDVLSTFFWLLTIWAYTNYVKLPGVKRYCITLVLFLFGLMSKPMVVTLPFVLILLDYWPLNRFADNQNQAAGSGDIERKTTKSLILEKIPLLAVALFSCVVTYIVQKQAGAVGASESFSLDVRIVNAVISYAAYLGKMIWPVDLSVFYPHPGIWPLWKAFLSGSILVISTFLVYIWSRRYPYLAVGWLWYIGTLVPVIGFVQVGAQAMADRYTYIPLIGLFILTAWGFADVFRRVPHNKVILGFASFLIIVILSILSWQRCSLWGNNVALWNDVLKKHKVSFAYIVRGIGHAENGQYQLAVEDYNRAFLIDGVAAEGLNNRAIAFDALGKRDRAFQDLDLALRLKPRFADTFYNRGMIHKNMGQYDAAIADFTKALTIQPDMVDALNNRGIVFGSRAQYDKALADFNAALKINRNFAQAYYNRGTLYNILKKYDLAYADFSKAVRIKPDYADAYNNMAFTLEAQGKISGALEYYLTAVQIQPNHAQAHNNIGIILARAGKDKEAVSHFRKAVEIRPDYEDAARNLQAALVRLNKR